MHTLPQIKKKQFSTNSVEGNSPLAADLSTMVEQTPSLANFTLILPSPRWMS
jgi:hypothetical protein